jgi:hypothetical protein
MARIKPASVSISAAMERSRGGSRPASGGVTAGAGRPRGPWRPGMAAARRRSLSERETRRSVLQNTLKIAIGWGYFVLGIRESPIPRRLYAELQTTH